MYSDKSRDNIKVLFLQFATFQTDQFKYFGTH
uniref:Uncharacterized protein n=1 Tax=Arundo donax TaxID=35708 RepID=A0A0A8ZQK7_ARUDO